jgi:hypothetical protein
MRTVAVVRAVGGEVLVEGNGIELSLAPVFPALVVEPV